VFGSLEERAFRINGGNGRESSLLSCLEIFVSLHRNKNPKYGGTKKYMEGELWRVLNEFSNLSYPTIILSNQRKY
jgi:hypothetical protein